MQSSLDINNTLDTTSPFRSPRRKPFPSDAEPRQDKKSPSTENAFDVDKLVDELIKENQEAMKDNRSHIEFGKKKTRRIGERGDLLTPVSPSLENEELIYALLEANNKSDDEDEEEQPGPPNFPLVVEEATKASNSARVLETKVKEDLGDPFARISQKSAVVQESEGDIPTVNEYLSIRLPSIDFQPYYQLIKEQIHLQNLWVLSHVLTIFGSALYVYGRVSNNELLECYSYKVVTFGSLLTYLIVLYRSNSEERVVEFNENKNEVIVKAKIMTMSEFVRNENAQLLGYVLLWIFTPRSVFKLVPFFIYSSLNLTSFFTFEVIPDYSFSAALLPLLNYLEVPLLITASHFDVVSFGTVLIESIELQNGYPITIFTFIWLLRYERSEACRSSFNLILSCVSGIFTTLTYFLPTTFSLPKDKPIVQQQPTATPTFIKTKVNAVPGSRFTRTTEAFEEQGGSSATLTAEI